MTKNEAEGHVRDFEVRLAGLLRSVSPEEFVPAAAQRLRFAVKDGMFGNYPPHLMIWAIEACCAYWQQWCFSGLTEDKLREIVRLLIEFEDPAVTKALSPDSDLFEFVLYMHRTQMEVQGGGWWIPMGRLIRMFRSAGDAPSCDAALRRRFGLSLREWMQLSYAILAGTLDRRCKFTHRYAAEFPSLGVPGEKVQIFLDEVSRFPAQIGEHYREIRETAPPLTWSQRRPGLATWPLVRLAQGYVAPSEAYVVDLFGESLFRRLVAENADDVRKELGRLFERYVVDMVRALLPDVELWTAADLVLPGERSCDFVLELSDCRLLLECKAVVFDREVVTRNAVLNSGTVKRVIDGYEQTIRTAERVARGSYSHKGLTPSAKPMIAAVATIGELPGFNHTAVWKHAQSVLASRGCPSDPRPSILRHIPQTLHGLALEQLLLTLRANIADASTLFDERANAPPFSIGEWQYELGKKLQARKDHDLSFWRDAVFELVEQLTASASRSTPTSLHAR